MNTKNPLTAAIRGRADYREAKDAMYDRVGSAGKNTSAAMNALNRDQNVGDVMMVVRSSGQELVNLADDLGRTPVHHAAMGIKLVVLEKVAGIPGADVNARTHNGWTPLRFAVEKIRPKNVRHLLMRTSADATLRSTDDEPLTPGEAAERLFANGAPG